ncbi:hypothetical protein KSP40_PGU012264 [Platanthera guangdongensis]|uniref:Uncharacterized protein n=1 Tax=Platanthera guangdongensis TaxID=2320717 RepID=A0ABR2LKW2_9ASPA
MSRLQSISTLSPTEGSPSVVGCAKSSRRSLEEIEVTLVLILYTFLNLWMGIQPCDSPLSTSSMSRLRSISTQSPTEGSPSVVGCAISSRRSLKEIEATLVLILYPFLNLWMGIQNFERVNLLPSKLTFVAWGKKRQSPWKKWESKNNSSSELSSGVWADHKQRLKYSKAKAQLIKEPVIKINDALEIQKGRTAIVRSCIHERRFITIVFMIATANALPDMVAVFPSKPFSKFPRACPLPPQNPDPLEFLRELQVIRRVSLIRRVTLVSPILAAIFADSVAHSQRFSEPLLSAAAWRFWNLLFMNCNSASIADSPGYAGFDYFRC